MKTIFDEVEMHHLKMKNRLVRSATWEAMCSKSGEIPDGLTDIYEELAKGGIGMIITAFDSVSDLDGMNHEMVPDMMRISNDTLIHGHQKLTDAVHRCGCPIITQLALGEYCSEDAQGNILTVEPDQMTKADIRDVIRLFRDAAVRAGKAGYDGVQIHGAHGFFLSRFLSPLYNHRIDEYGGSAENRSHLIVDILHAIREAVPEMHISVKINCSDFISGGLDVDESMAECLYFAEEGIDSIEVSGNGTSRRGIRPGEGEGYFMDFAAELASRTDVPVILVGGNRSIGYMEKILNMSGIECLSLSRPLIREPGLPNRWKEGDSAPSKCISCNMCYETLNHRCFFAKLRHHFALLRSICSCPHLYRSLRVGRRAFPRSFREYSTCGDAESNCLRLTRLSSSSSFNDFVSMILVIPGTLRLSSL